jgi:23S rRNA pseudouridine2605 synthase
MQIRLNKFISDSGLMSRRKADEAISNGDIEVNGTTVSELGLKVDPEKDVVKCNGRFVKAEPELVYYAVYKPNGVISTAQDEKGRDNVVGLVPRFPRVYPVGRLDAYSEGLMILTNDGDLTQKLTHPSFEHEKEYEVTVHISDEELRYNVNLIGHLKKSFTDGLQIEGKLMKADRIFIKDNEKSLLLSLVLHTGYNRQIRKMCAQIGLAVSKIKRIRIGRLNLQPLNLKPGEYKKIEKYQII